MKFKWSSTGEELLLVLLCGLFWTMVNKRPCYAGVMAAADLQQSCVSDTDCLKGLRCDENNEWCARCVCSQWGITEGLCPGYCLCQSSDACQDEFSYCRKISRQASTCVECDESYCSEALLESTNSTESCRDVCPRQYQCNQHSDCGTNGEWCAGNHRCQQCSLNCWTRRRSRPNDGGEGDDFNSLSQYAQDSIDLGCPENCCDWGLRATESWEPNFLYVTEDSFQTSLHVTLAPCQADLEFLAYVVKGRYPEWSPNDFIQQGRRCEIQRYEYDDGLFPPVVTTVDCPDFVSSCDKENATVALLEKGPTDTSFEFATLSVSNYTVWDDFQATYPMAGLISHDSEGCQFEDILRFLRLIAIIAVVIFIICVVGCVYCCVRCNRRRQEQEQASQSPADVAVQDTKPLGNAIPAGNSGDKPGKTMDQDP